jgi:PIN domain nuclease of toxin-antitoxin system
VNDASAVLDASALLAVLHGERGADRVQQYLVRGGVVMSTVNYCEAVGKLAERGKDIEAFRRAFQELGIALIQLDEATAAEAGRLKMSARRLGLSIGDRVCLALGRRLGIETLTTDGLWSQVGAEYRVVLIR